MKKNKKGMAFVWMASLIVAFLVISIVASIFGLKFITSILDQIKWQYIMLVVIIGLAVVFRGFVEAVLMTLLGVVKSIFGI
jgi:hypothetical protein